MHRSKKRCYSITSSASPSSLTGMVKPSALAVLRLSCQSGYWSASFDAKVTGRFLCFEDEPSSHRRVNDLVAQFMTGEVVESVSRTVTGDQMVEIDLL